MICPNCGRSNLPGAEECDNCQQSLTALDQPMAQSLVEKNLMTESVAVLKPKGPVTILSTTPTRAAMELMLAQNIGALLVVDEAGDLLGIFSERDLLTRVAGLRDDYAELPVSDFMTRNPETVTCEAKLVFAVHKMDVGGYRHLPILTDGKPSGVLSVRDMLRHITRLCKDG